MEKIVIVNNELMKNKGTPESQTFKKRIGLVIMASNWRLLTGGRYLELVVRTNLTVLLITVQIV